LINRTRARHELMGTNLADYQKVIRGFVNGDLGVREFESLYLRMFKEDSAIRPDAEYEILNNLFSAVDTYCENTALRQPFSLDEQQLRSEANAAFQALAALSRDG